MIKEIKRTSQFKKDYKKAIKSGCKEEDFREVLKYLVAQKPLPEKYRDHHEIMPTISQYENDAIDIKCRVLREIADALQVFPGYFFMGDDLNPTVREALDTLGSIKDERLLQAALDHIRVTSLVRLN